MNNYQEISSEDLARIGGVKLLKKEEPHSGVSSEELAEIAGVKLVQKPQKSFFQQAGQAVEDIPRQLWDALDGAAEGAYGGIRKAAKPLGLDLPESRLPGVRHGQYPERAGHFLGEAALPFLPASGIARGISAVAPAIKGLGALAPAVGISEAALTPGSLEERLKSGMIGAGLTAAPVPAMGVGKALLGAGKSLVGAGKRAFESARGIPGLKTLSGRSVEDATKSFGEEARNIVADHYGTRDFKSILGTENKLIGQELRLNYKKQVKEGNRLYEDALNKVGENKFSLPDIPGLKTKDYKFAQDIRKFSEGRVVNNALNKMISNPTVNTAHELQSKLGRQISQLRGKPYAARDNDAIDSLESIRDSMRSQIDSQAGPGYKRASKHWFENVVPYYKDSIINNAVRRNIPSASLAKRLGREEIDPVAGDPISTVVRHMTAEQKEKALLPSIRGSIGSTGEVNPVNLLDRLLKLRSSGMSDFVSADTENAINRLLSKQAEIPRKQRLSSLARKGAGGLGALGIGAEVGRMLKGH